MKNVLIILSLITLVVCQEYKERHKKRIQYRKEIIDCVLNNENSSEELKNKIRKEKGEDYRKILHIFIAKLNLEDHEIIRKCKRMYFRKIRDMYKERYHEHYNRNYTHHHIHDYEKSLPKEKSSLHGSNYKPFHPMSSAHPSHSGITSRKSSASSAKPVHSSSNLKSSTHSSGASNK